MTNNTSATGGYLSPVTSPAPLDDADLEDFFQEMIVGITGLDKTLVRPAWQGQPPNIPNAKTDFNHPVQNMPVWCAFHFQDEESDTYPWVGENSEGTAEQLQRNEQFGVICSFYSISASGQALSTAKVLRDGLAIAQNREPLFNNGMGLIEVTAPQPAPVLMKETWLYRSDITIRIRRNVVREYGVLNIASAEVDFDIDANAKEINRTTEVENT